MSQNTTASLEQLLKRLGHVPVLLQYLGLKPRNSLAGPMWSSETERPPWEQCTRVKSNFSFLTTERGQQDKITRGEEWRGGKEKPYPWARHTRKKFNYKKENSTYLADTNLDNSWNKVKLQIYSQVLFFSLIARSFPYLNYQIANLHSIDVSE